MKSSGGTKTNYSDDPSIDAIFRKRAPFIENIYNKNLRPIVDFHDANQTSTISNNQKESQHQHQQQSSESQSSQKQNPALSNQPTKLSLVPEYTFLRDATTLSVSSFFNDFNAQDNDALSTTGVNDKTQVTDGGAKIYTTTCQELKIVPCSIVIKSLPTTVLALNGYGLGPNGTLALANALKLNLTVVKLDLSSNSVGPHGVKFLARMLDENSTITELNLSQNEIGTDGVPFLIDLFRRNRFLREIDLSENDFTDDDGVLLADALEDQQLTKINLSHNGFSEKAGISFGKWLGDNNQLLDLDLSWNHIRKKGALLLAKGLSENNKLVRFDISWNGFENTGAEAIGKSLVHNVILQELNIKCNRIGPIGFAKICSSLKDNTSLKKLYIGKNHITQEALETALKLFITINAFSLELLDVSEVSIKPTINQSIEMVKSSHSRFNCIYGFLNTTEKKVHNPNEEALNYINNYCVENNISLMDLFSKMDSDGSMAVSYDEFKAGLKKAKVPITASQVDSLIKYLDKDNDGEIDFSELILGEEKARLARNSQN